MKANVFSYRSYKAYLRAAIADKTIHGWGSKSALARALSCQTSHISQVLKGQSHFSLEQADNVNNFLDHSRDEAQFFLLLLQLERAGTQSLRDFLQTQLDQLLEKQLVLKNRVNIKRVLSGEDQATYYSAWYYAAVHILITIPGFQTKNEISGYLGLSTRRVSEILDYLVSINLAVKLGNRYRVGDARIYLGSDSSMVAKHHANWRIQAIQSLDRGSTKSDLHYSSVISLSRSDCENIKLQLVKSIEEIKARVKDSKEEELMCFSLDFFKIRDKTRLDE